MSPINFRPFQAQRELFRVIPSASLRAIVTHNREVLKTSKDCKLPIYVAQARLELQRRALRDIAQDKIATNNGEP